MHVVQFLLLQQSRVPGCTAAGVSPAAEGTRRSLLIPLRTLDVRDVLSIDDDVDLSGVIVSYGQMIAPDINLNVSG